MNRWQDQDVSKVWSTGLVAPPRRLASTVVVPPTKWLAMLANHRKRCDQFNRRITAIRDIRTGLTQLQGPYHTPIDETELYLSVVERSGKGHVYGLWWTPLGSRRTHAGVRSSRSMAANDEPIEQLRRVINEIQRSLLRVIQDKTLDLDQLREM
ncbi:hypothetical protein Scep_025601 [Stephania cephalantha]|uniref:Uncharacterized protein n=1 Tax=Stephania cephalantha TaxID=152367 RepID=A0AAP0ELU3_9MAGN